MTQSPTLQAGPTITAGGSIPIVRSLLDTDFYKLLMLQMIREFYPDQQVTFSVINRTRHVRLAEIIDEGELRAQLDHARTIRFTKNELIWLAGNTFYGKTQMFSADFIRWLAEFPPARIRAAQGRRASTSCISTGPGPTPRCGRFRRSPSSTSCARAQAMKGQGRFELDVLYARAKAKLWAKVERLRKLTTCGSPISARAAAMAFSGSAGASRRSRKASARPSPAPPTCCSRWTMISKPSAPTPMSCRWWPRRSPMTTPSCAGRPIASSTSGATPMAAIC